MTADQPGDGASRHERDAAVTSHRPPGPRPPPVAPRDRWITWRSVLIGTLSVIVICALSPFNDRVVANTSLVNNFLPLAMILTFFVLVVVVNAPLLYLAPRQALSHGELATIMLMLLVGCSIPGLMVIFLPTLIGPFYLGATDESIWDLLVSMDLPGWVFPAALTDEERNSPVIIDFVGRLQVGDVVPYAAWLGPLLGWGVFLAALFATFIAVVIMIRPQWSMNERLAFPLAQIQLALIEPPQRGRALNELFRSRAFWIALGGVFFLHSFSALHLYFPRYVPEIPLRYDFTDIFTEEPWVHLQYQIKRCRIYFTFIGITYFIQARTGFSLWAIFLLTQVVNIQQGMTQREMSQHAWTDQMFGAAVVFVLFFFWIGRRHWAMILRQTFRGPEPGESTGDYLTYRTAMIVALAGIGVMVAWLAVVGVQIWVALFIVGFILMGHLVVSRVVAEAGLPFFRVLVGVPQFQSNLPTELFNSQDIFFGRKLGSNIVRDSSGSLMTYFMHGTEVTERSGAGGARGRRGMLLVLACWALGLGLLTGGVASLATYYRYETSITETEQRNYFWWEVDAVSAREILEPVNQHGRGHWPDTPHNSRMHIGIGAGVMALLQIAALRWTSWPFMPVGYLASATYQLRVAWFSIFLGWLAKVLVVRWGGAHVYQRGKSFFIGLIFGEMVAAGIWLLITLALALSGFQYERVSMLP